MPVINTNIAANTALRYLNQNASSTTSSLAKLASGSLITKASDDAAGLAVGTQLQSDIVVFSQAGMNASRASATMEKADGSAARIGDILERMKALATESAGGNVTQKERTDIQEEFGKLNSDITNIVKSTKVGDKPLLDGSFTDTIFVTKDTKINLAVGDFSAEGLGVDQLNVASQEDAATALTALNKATEQVTKQRADIGATMNRFQFQSATRGTIGKEISAATASIVDADVPTEKSKLSSADIKTQAAIAALSQANRMPQELLKLLQ